MDNPSLNLRGVVQSLETKLLLAPDGQWTKDFNEALHFCSMVEAWALCEKLKIQNVAYGLTFDGQDFQLRVPFFTRTDIEPVSTEVPARA